MAHCRINTLYVALRGGRPARGFSILLHPGSAEEAERLFHLLAENGIVRMPLQETFWSPRFGSVTDQFGLNWTINYEKTE